MLRPSELSTTGLLAAITDGALQGAYREMCITELATRIDNPRAAGVERRGGDALQVDLTGQAHQVWRERHPSNPQYQAIGRSRLGTVPSLIPRRSSRSAVERAK